MVIQVFLNFPMGIHNGVLYLIALGGLGYFLLFMLSIFSFAHNYTDQRLFIY